MLTKGSSTLLMQRPPTTTADLAGARSTSFRWLTADAMPALVFATGLVALIGSGIPVASRDTIATGLIFLIVVSVDRALRGRHRP